MPLAGEGAMKAISDKTGIVFSRVKIGFIVTPDCIWTKQSEDKKKNQNIKNSTFKK